MAAGAAGRLEDRLAVRACGRERRAASGPVRAGHSGDVGSDVHGVLALDDVCGHLRLGCEALAVLDRRVRRDRTGAEPDLVEDDVLDRAVRVALLPRGGEGVVEVRPDRSRRACSLQRVAGAAALLEELL